ncbi:MFS transporter [Trinickia caryophylli]|uniref:Predicted arabinose efflux permease, MFS family n=1 Tax=Trinickia caryophylli TaxID=28094 RepID=A0A1X7FTF9_TRICW|nr:MFS transporter [Trinickia caryophylli]PMS11910.1 MFS transporter [Trinickia caryophylli]TRX14014.1 MFS transporter [Trinickia caryophylli]WQE15611.1 MFS transporter [Trinickia caryophylli]SMF58522.1 Predicted arabinose efflux permease, MFS family [Trinickia caryophylli]GLU33626.1 MFS transporter [Trinickia caryophylli]
MATHSTATTRADSDAPLFSIKPFRLLLAIRVLSTLGIQMLLVAIGWQMYALTHDAWALALVGLYQFLPVLLLTPPAGYAADHWRRTRIVSVSLAIQTVAAAGLAVATFRHGMTRDALLWVSLLLGAARAFQLPALQALAPSTVPPAQFSRAMAVFSMGSQTSIIVGPALGGFLAVFGLGLVYAVSATALFVGMAMAAQLSVHGQTAVQKGPLLEALVGGLRFVWQKPIVLAAISLDLFAVLFGGATALLPIYAGDILHGGPAMLGWLRAAPAVGALAMSLCLARRPPRHRVGVTLLGAVVIFGLATVVFGISTSFWLSEIALIVSGAADAVSVVIRQTLVQLETPDHMRGRVSAVNAVFIGASNQLGEFESGAAASWLGPVAAVVSGGLLTCFVAVMWAWRFPQLTKRTSLEG